MDVIIFAELDVFLQWPYELSADLKPYPTGICDLSAIYLHRSVAGISVPKSEENPHSDALSIN